jgi:hypothetical protein
MLIQHYYDYQTSYYKSSESVKPQSYPKYRTKDSIQVSEFNSKSNNNGWKKEKTKFNKIDHIVELYVLLYDQGYYK